MKKFKRYMKRAIRQFKATFLNKHYATIVLALGWVSLKISNDATAFVFILTIAVPLILSKENCIIG